MPLQIPTPLWKAQTESQSNLKLKPSIATLTSAQKRAAEVPRVLSWPEDLHYDLVTPDDYVKLRIVPLIKFYQSRMPRYRRALLVCNIALVVGPTLAAILAFVGTNTSPAVAAWVAVVSIVTSAVTAWLEFHGTNGKLTRYSGIVDNLSKLKLWWHSLPEIQRASVQNIDYLVGTCEELVEGEWQQYFSTSQASKLLNKASGGDEQDSNEKDEDEKKKQ